MRNVEKLYSDAIRNSVGGITLTDVSKAIAQFEKEGKLALEQENNGVDNNKDLRYSFNQYKTEAKIWANATNRKNGDEKVLYNAKNNTWNRLVADSTEDDGFYVAESIKDISENEAKIYRLVFGDKYDNSNKETRTNDRIIKELKNDKRGNRGYDDANLQKRFNDGQTGGLYRQKQTSDTTRDNDRSKEDSRYSLKSTDSQGNTLTPAQQEFFKDSKIRATNGSLLVLYHGSKNDFTVFDTNFGGQSNDIAKIGYWFAESKNGAQDFADSVWYGDKEKAKVYEVYLNVKKPKIYKSFEGDQNLGDKLKKQIEELIEKVSNIEDKYMPSDVGYSKSSIFGRMTRLKNDFEELSSEFKKDFSDSMSKDEMQQYLDDAKNSRECQQKILDLEAEIAAKVKYTDAYEQFRADIYKLAGFNADYANSFNVGRPIWDEKLGKFLDKNIFIEQYKENLKKDGYDGIIIKDTNYDADNFGEPNTQYVVFDSNQIKLIANKKPTKNEDIRYSLKSDSEGNRLTEQQASYFENSKIRNQNGQLLVAYHGTDANFNEFKNKPAQYGRAICDGFYFTLRKSNAEKYGKNVKEVYLNIEKPFYLHNGNGLLAELSDRDYTISRLVKEFNAETDDTGLPTPKALKKVLEKLGYDGVVSDTIDGDTDIVDTTYSETQIVAFKSSQIKYIYNDRPTNSKDLRYSLAVDKTKANNYTENNNVRESEDGRRYLHNDKSEKWNVGLRAIEQVGNFQEKPGETRQREGGKNQREIIRRFPTEEKTVRNVKIKQINHNDWNDFEKELAQRINAEIGLKVEFYTGSAVPPNVKDEDAEGFDGFMDSRNNTMYLRSDSTLSEEEIETASNHEGVHHIKAVKPELFKDVEKVIINNISIQDYSELIKVYSENYSEIYGYDLDRFNEEIIADIISKRITATIDNIETVNEEIEKLYKSFNPKTSSKKIKSGDLRYSLSNDNITDLIFDTAAEDNGTQKETTQKAQKPALVRQQTKEQIAKYVASHSKDKVYSKTDAEETINAILENQLNFGDKYGELSGKTKEQVVDKL